MLRLTLLYTARPDSFDSPLTLSPSKGERFAQDVLVDQPPRFALRRSAVASAKADGRARQQGSWFDSLTMSVYGEMALATAVGPEREVNSR